jgi:RecG-like helicase
VNKSVKDIFSKRRRQILEVLKKEYGITEAEAHRSLANYIARTTRKSKEKVEQTELDRFWEQQLKEIGYTRERLIREYEEANKEFVRNRTYLTQEEEKELLKSTLTDLHENYSLIDETILQKEYLKRLFAKVNEENLQLSNYDSLMERFNQNIEELKKEGYLKQRKLTIGRTTIENSYFYTREQELYERDSVRIAQELSEKEFSKRVSKQEIKKEIEAFQNRKGFQLAEEQSKAVYEILDSKSSVLVIEGDAGAGKTTSLEVVKEIADKKGIKTIGLAPTGKAGEELNKTLGRGETIDSFLLKVQRGEIGKKELRNSLIVVDEAGMVSCLLYTSPSPRD